MVSAGIKAGTAVSAVVVLLALLYKKNGDEELRQHMDDVLRGLLRAERKVQLPNEPRVAVGFGACLDVFSSGLEILQSVGASPPDEVEHFNQISNLDELEKVFAYFFRHGAAAERYVSNKTFFEELVTAARNSVDYRHALGGNAPVMAKRFHEEGCQVLLGSTVSDELLSNIPPEIKLAGQKLPVDDIHLLMEYQKGADWDGRYYAPRANRFIIHNDNNNPGLKSMSEFVKEVKQFSPSLVVVSGLQMMDNFPYKQGERRKLLGELRDMMASVSMDTRMHFEMASFAEEACMNDVIENVVKYSDSLGMNEQELPNLYSMLTNSTITLISDPVPRIATTLDHMRAVYRKLRQTQEISGQRKLTRLHVHTLAYQAIITAKGSAWKNSMSAMAKASLTATRHVCGSNYIHTHKAKLLMDDSFSTSRDDGSSRIPFQANRPVSCWDEEDYEICLAPVLVCTEVVQTAGGGDNISSAGLVLQI